MDQSFFKIALNYQAVIFDFDGVIAKIDVNWSSLKKELQEFIKKKTGTCNELTPFDLQLNRILKAAPKTLTEHVNQIIEFYELKDFDRHLVFPDMLAIAKELANNNVALFICSSNTQKVIATILLQAGILANFRQIVTREDVHQRKPSPEGLKKILVDNHLNPDSVLFIGDKEVDRKAGLAAGIKTFIIQSGTPIYLTELPPSPPHC